MRRNFFYYSFCMAASLSTALYSPPALSAPGDIQAAFAISNISGDGRTPTTPQGITYHDGYLWVVDFGTDRIYRVYPTDVYEDDGVTLRFSQGESDFNIPIPDNNIPPLDSDGNPIGSCFDNSSGVPQYCGGGGLTFAENFLWNASPITDDIIKVDPVDGDNLETENTLSSLAFPSPTGMTFDGTYFWIVDWQSNTINKVLPEDGTIVDTIPGPSSFPAYDINPSVTNARPFGLTWDGQALWASDQEEQRIYRINPDDGSLLNYFDSPSSDPKGLTWDGEFLWSVDQSTQLLYKHDAGIIPFGIVGCIEKNGKPVDGDVLLHQTAIPDQADSTDTDGCFAFASFTAGIPIQIQLSETGVDEKPFIQLTETEPGITDVTLIVGDIYSEPGYTANDTEDGDISADVIATPDVINTPGLIDTSSPNPTGVQVAYDVVDSAGNHADTTYRTIYVLEADTTPPVITLIGEDPVYVEQESSYTDAGATATDDRDGDLGTITATGSVDVNTAGTYTLYYNISDSTGNAATTVTRTVIVQDTSLPSITILGSNPYTHERGDTYTDAGATANDNIDGNITGDIVVTGSVSPNTSGSYVINYDVADSSGNNAPTVSRTVNVVDTTAPVLTLIGSDPINHELNTPFDDPMANAIDYPGDSLNGSVVVSGAVDTATPGSYTLNYDVTDLAGNAATRISRTVIVSDTGSPTITLVGDNPLFHEQGTAFTNPGATASDAIDGDLTASIVESGTVDINTQGNYTLSYDVQDSTGNSAPTVNRTVTVVDTTPPTITLTGDNPLNHEVNTFFNDPGATANDNIDGNITSSIGVTGTVDAATVGSYTLVYSVQDSSGNDATQISRTVNVQDTGAPSIALTGSNPILHELQAVFTDPGATASDAADGDLTSSIVVGGDTVDRNTAGTYNITYNVTDSQGNPATQVTRSVIVADRTSPTITLVGANPLTHEQGTTFSDPGAIANDAIDGNINGSIVTSGTVDQNTRGTYFVNYNVSDAAGNAATQVTRTINVVDTTIPVITLVGSNPIDHEVNTIFSDPGATASDNIDGNITGSIGKSDNIDATTLGSYSITYNVQDSAGNNAVTVTRTVNVVDTGAPSIALVGDNPILHELQTPFSDPGATASDAADGDLTSSIVVSGSVNPNTPGTYTLSYNVTDSQSNPAGTVTRDVIVADRTDPTITLSGSSTINIEQGAPYSEPGYSANDNIDGNISGSVVVSGTVDHNVRGTYQLNYNVTDSAGNTAATVTRTINVDDTTAPTITLVGGNPIDHEVNTPFLDPGATASDNIDGVITNDIGVSGTVNASVLGSYVLNYNVQDSAGNNAITATRTVNVVDTGAPAITLEGSNPVLHELQTPYTDAGATAWDAVDGDISGSIVTTGSVNTSAAGTYVMRYNVSDSQGNDATEVTRDVIVADRTAPTITLNGSATINHEQGTAYSDDGATASDTVDGNLDAQIVVNNPVNINVADNYTITYNVSDFSSNAATEVTRLVTVQDTTPPVITLIGDSVVEHASGGASWVDPGWTAIDSVDGDISANVTTTPQGNAGGYLLTYNVSDAAGNDAASVTRQVNVVTPSQIDIEAETGTIGGSHLVSATETGYTGSGYIELKGTGYLEFTFDAYAVPYTLSIRYSMNGGDSPTEVVLNSTSEGTLPLNSTGGYSIWSTSGTLTITPNSGTNTLRLNIPTNQDGAYIDSISITPQ